MSVQPGLCPALGSGTQQHTLGQSRVRRAAVPAAGRDPGLSLNLAHHPVIGAPAPCPGHLPAPGSLPKAWAIGNYLRRADCNSSSMDPKQLCKYRKLFILKINRYLL